MSLVPSPRKPLNRKTSSHFWFLGSFSLWHSTLWAMPPFHFLSFRSVVFLFFLFIRPVLWLLFGFPSTARWRRAPGPCSWTRLFSATLTGYSLCFPLTNYKLYPNPALFPKRLGRCFQLPLQRVLQKCLTGKSNSVCRTEFTVHSVTMPVSACCWGKDSHIGALWMVEHTTLDTGLMMDSSSLAACPST